MRDWFSAYLEWLLSSRYGVDEAAQTNNHGTWYDVQVACLALFAERTDVAAAVLERAAECRLAAQIEPDGRQPLELARTRALSYSVMNLLGMFDLATLAAPLGIDLWHWEGSDGRSIGRAFSWLVAHALDAPGWKYTQITPFEPSRWIEVLRRGGLAFGDTVCEARMRQLGVDDLAASRTQLLHPHPEWLAGRPDAGP